MLIQVSWGTTCMYVHVHVLRLCCIPTMCYYSSMGTSETESCSFAATYMSLHTYNMYMYILHAPMGTLVMLLCLVVVCGHVYVY